VPDLFLSIFGGFQPDVMAQVLARRGKPGDAGPDNGMAARFSLMVWPEPTKTRWVDEAPDRDAGESVNRVFRELSKLDPEAFVGSPFMDAFRPLTFTQKAEAIFRQWYTEHHHLQGEIEKVGEAPLHHHFAKYDGLFIRLALVQHLLRYSSDRLNAICARMPERYTGT
jgi:Protein of unknown function (DUF3987)